MDDQNSGPEIGVDGVSIELPAPSIWPAAVGVGVALALFGIVTSLAFSVVGLVLLAIGIGGWIGDLDNG